MSNQWAKVPIEALQDERLSSTEFRVLVGLLSFANQDGRLMYVKRQTLADRCNVHLSQITRATAALARYGWLDKSGTGGKSRPAGYRVMIPFTCVKSAQVKRANVSEIVTNTCAESCHQTCDDFAQGKEQTFVQKREQSAPPRLLNALRARLRKQDDGAIDKFSRAVDLQPGNRETYFEFKQRLIDQVFPGMDAEHLRDCHAALDRIEGKANCQSA